MSSLYQSIKDKGYDPLVSPAGGGQAFVYKVKNIEYGNVIGLRVYKTPIVSKRLEEDKTFLDFKKECKLLLRLGNGTHPNIIKISNPQLIAGHPTYEMDFLEGQDLEGYLKTQKCLEVLFFTKLMTEMSSALAYCHFDVYKYSIDPNEKTNQPFLEKNSKNEWVPKKGTEKIFADAYKVIHNDIHTKNIFIKDGIRFILLDFGLSFDTSQGLRTSLRPAGVPSYKAPERFDSGNMPNEQTDIYSFGVLLFECLTGRLPFIKSTNITSDVAEANELLNNHKSTPVPEIWPIRQAALKEKGINITDKDYPDWFELVINKCMAKAPKDRYQNGKELHLAVLAFIEKQTETDQRQLVAAAMTAFETKQQAAEATLKNQHQTALLALNSTIATLKTRQSLNDKEQGEATTELQKVQILLELKKQRNQILNTKVTDLETLIDNLKLTIKQSGTIEIVKAKEAENTALKAQITRLKSTYRNKIFGIGFLAATLGLGWMLNGSPTTKSSEVVVADSTASYDTSAAAIDSSAAAADSATFTYSFEEAEAIIKRFERVRGITPPFDTLSVIVKEHPQFKNRAYSLYVTEAIRLNDIQSGYGADCAKLAKKIENL